MAQGLERYPFAIVPDFKYQPVRANFPEQSQPEIKLVGFEPDPTPEPEAAPAAPRSVIDDVVGMGKAAYQGVFGTGRMLGAAANTYLNDLSDVELYAEAQKVAASDSPAAKREFMAEIERRKAANPDGSVLSKIGDVFGAAASNKMGTAQFVAEQAPNTVVSLGGGWAGAKAGAALGGMGAGPAGAAVGGVGGFLTGMFLGNTLLETGGKAMEKAGDGFTADERGEAIREGAIKGGVITGVDAATLGAGGLLAKSLNRAAIQAGARAEAQVLADAGVDLGSRAAVETALASNKALRDSAMLAGQKAASEASTLGRRAAIGGTGLTMETVGEGGGEYLGELAATGKADVHDAALEALAGFTQSGAETAWNMRKSSGNDLDAKGIIKERDSVRRPPAMEGEFVPSDNLSLAGHSMRAGETFDQLRPTLPPDESMSGDVFGPESLPAGQRLLPSPPIEGEAVADPAQFARPALPAPEDGGPTERQVATARGLLNHSPKASPDLLMRLMRVDSTMAGMLFNHWQTSQQTQPLPVNAAAPSVQTVTAPSQGEASQSENKWAAFDAEQDQPTREDWLERIARKVRDDADLNAILDRVQVDIGREHSSNLARSAYAVMVNPAAKDETKARAKQLHDRAFPNSEPAAPLSEQGAPGAVAQPMAQPVAPEAMDIPSTENQPNPALPQADATDIPADISPAIARIKGGKLELTGFNEAEVKEVASNLNLDVRTGRDGKMLVAGRTRTGETANVSIKAENAIKAALIGREVKQPKKRGFTGNLRNDLNILAPGLMGEVERGGDGEATGRFDVGMIAESLRDEYGYTQIGNYGDSKAAGESLIDMIREGGAVNEERMLAEKSAEDARAQRAEVEQLANEYGIKYRFRKFADVMADVLKVIEEEVSIASRGALAIGKDAIDRGILTATEVKDILRSTAPAYTTDRRLTKKLLAWRDAANTLQDRVNEYDSREEGNDAGSVREIGDGRDQGNAVTGEDRGAREEDRPAFDLRRQTRADLAAKEARANDEALAERERIKAESEFASNKFTLQAQEKPVEVREAENLRRTPSLFGSENPANAKPAESSDKIAGKPVSEMTEDQLRTIARGLSPTYGEAAVDKAKAELRRRTSMPIDQKTPADAGVSVSGSEFSSLEKELAAKARDTEVDGDIGVVVGGGKVRFVSMADAVDAANKAIMSGTKAVPFQISNATGIRIGDVDRVLVAGEKVGAGGTATTEKTLAVEPQEEGNIAQHESLFASLRDGTSTLEEFKAGFSAVVDGKDAIKDELSALTKDSIFKRFPGLAYRYKNDKKADVVDAAYRSMLDSFVLGDSIQWSMGQKYEDVIRGYVEKTTEESLQEFADKVKVAKEERAAQRKAAEAGMDNPVTLDDYKRILAAKAQEIGEGATFGQARMAMTPEQRARFDELTAEQSRGERKARADQQRAEVRVAAATTEGQIVETKHTRTGEPLFVVKAAERVERDVYNQWNATAKKLNGWYSSFRGSGAVPGFQFKTRENAEAFLKYLGGNVEQAKEAVQARRDSFEDDRSQSAAERLNEMADRLEEQAGEVLSADRKTNTARRARFAASAEASANAQQAMAQTMRNIAAAIESGQAKFLDRVRQKVQIERMQAWLASAQYDEQRAKYPTYAEQEKHRGEKPTGETADYAKFPEFTAFRSDLAQMGRRLLEIDGAKQLGTRLLKVADDVTAAYKKFAKENLHKVSTFKGANGEAAVFRTEDAAEAAIARSGFKGKATTISFKRGEHLVIMGPEMAKEAGLWQGDDDKRITLSPDFAEEIVAKAKGRDIGMPWTFETVAADRARLKAMGIETPAEFRAMLREFVAMREAPKAPDRVKELERKMIGRANDGLDFFPTPAETAQAMIDAAELKEGMSVLEPSAGWGHIAEKIRDAGVEPDVVELSGDRRELLEAKGFNLVSNDFMDVAGEYDRIIMNPPFGDRRDAEHVQHAYSLLKPGGRLVAIMGEGVFYGQDKKAQAFREWLESVGGTSEKLEEGTFLDSSLPVNTGVNARLVVVDRKQTDSGVAMFNAKSGARGNPIDAAALESTIARVIAGSPSHFSRDTVVTAPLFADLPAPILAKAKNEGYDSHGRKPNGEKLTGATYDGKVYLVQENISSELEAEETLLHERIHQIVHGNAKDPDGVALRQSLGKLYTRLGAKSGIERMAKEAGIDITGPLAAFPKVAAANRHAFLAEEFLAHAEGQRAYEKLPAKIKRAAREFWGEFRDWLRASKFVRIAEALGAKLDDFTQSDLAWMLKGIRQQEAGAGSKAIRFMTAWHGSPHDHDGFDSSKIGTGEGAQAYGWGHYFASRESVAKYYRDQLSKTTPAHNAIDGKRITKKLLEELQQSDDVGVRDFFNSKDGMRAAGIASIAPAIDSAIESAQEVRDDYQQRLDKHEANPPFASTYGPVDYRAWIAAQDRRIAGLRKLKERIGFVPAKKNGKLYQVELAPEADEYLDWDKPLSEQSEKVKAALENLPKKWAGLTRGEIIYKALAGDIVNQAHVGVDGEYVSLPDGFNEFKAASEYLLSLGIRGIKYLDGSSRNRPLKEIKAEFLAELPEDAGTAEVMELVGTGRFSPKNEALIKALAADDWLGFDYPAQAISAALGNGLSNYDASPALLRAVSDAKDGGTHNYVIFDDADVTITAKESRAAIQGGQASQSVKAIQDVVSRFKAEFKGAAVLDIRVVGSASEIPARFRPSPYAEGVFHDDAGLIYLVAGNLRTDDGKVNTRRAFQVLMHEAVGHYGLAAMMGERFSRITARVKEAARAKGKVNDDIYQPGHPDYATIEAVRLRYPDATENEIAQEVLARMAETDPGRTLFGYVRAMIRQWLRDAARALGIDLNITTSELNDLVALASAYMRRGDNLAEEQAPSGLVAASQKVGAGKGQAVMTGTRLADPTLADDMARQEKWLHQEATSRGFKSIDDLAEKNYPLFEKLAAMWRKKNPVEDALLSRASGLRVVDLFGNGSRVQHFDDKRGLFYEAQKYPSGRTGWRAGEVIDGMDFWLSDKEFGSMEEAQSAVRGLRASNTIRQKNAEKYGAIPALWAGEAKRVAKAIIDAGIGVDRFSASTQSKSKYVYLESGLKVRIADHALPASYDQADVDYRYGGDIKALIAEIKAAEGAPASTVDPDSAGSRSLGASRNEMQERPAVRADESGSPEEPTQSGGEAGSGTRLSAKVGAGKTVGGMESRRTVSGNSGRAYTAAQQAAFANVGREVETPSFRERVADLWSDIGKKMAQGIADQFAPLKDLDKDAYLLARMSKGADGALEAMLMYGKVFIRDGVYDVDAKDGGVIDKLLRPLGKEADDFLWWVAGNRAADLAKQGRENLMSTADIQALKDLAGGQMDFDYVLPNGKTTRDRATAYAASQRIFADFNRSVLDIAEQSGLIDGQARAVWESDFYVPFYRDMEGDKPAFPNVKSGLVRQKAFERLKGGDEKLHSDLLANTILNWSHLLHAAAKNRAAKAALEAAERAGAATWVPVSEKGSVSYRDGGDEFHYRVDDPFILDAVTALEFSGFGGPAMKAMGAFKRWLTIGVTASPTFKIRNLIRDSISAIGTTELSYNPIKNLKEGAKATSRDSQTYASMLASGGHIRFGTMIEGNRSDHVRRLVEKGVDPDTILDNPSKLKRVWSRHVMPLIDAWNEIGDRSENINRAAIYDQLRAKGMGHAEASLAARDLLDFSMGGTWAAVRFLTTVVPFANARIQGLYKLGRAAKDDPKRLGYVTGAVALASLALLAAGYDDDDWKKREDWDRDTYWWFKIGGVAFRIPKPFEIGAIGTLAERSAELLFDKEMDGKRFGDRIGSMVFNTFAMNPVPQMFKPLIDLYANRDSFTGRAIESMGMEKMRPEDRYTMRSSEFAKLIGKANVLSPVQVDHLIRGYFGWLGTAAATSVDSIVRIGESTPRPARELRDMFLIGSFVETLPSGSSRYVTKMYEQSKEIEEAYNSWQKYRKIGDAEKADEIYKANRDEIQKYRRAQQAKQMMTQLNAQSRRIEADRSLGSEDKRNRLRQIAAQKDRVARMVVH